MGLAIIVSAFIVANTWQKHLHAQQTLSVVGSAKRSFRSDRGFLRGSFASLMEKNIFVQVDPPAYVFTKIAGLKVEVQADAAKNALERAKKIAESTGSRLGSIRKARMGVIQITPQYSTNVSDYGENDTSSIEKEIQAVVSASFSLE